MCCGEVYFRYRILACYRIIVISYVMGSCVENKFFQTWRIFCRRSYSSFTMYWLNVCGLLKTILQFCSLFRIQFMCHFIHRFLLLWNQNYLIEMCSYTWFHVLAQNSSSSFWFSFMHIKEWLHKRHQHFRSFSSLAKKKTTRITGRCMKT